MLFHHTSLTYGGTGSWYYVEIPHGGDLTSNLFGLFNTLNQAWFMGLFFLIAGYFAPSAVARHGAWVFLKFLVTGSAAVAVCHVAAGLLLALPGLRRVL